MVNSRGSRLPYLLDSLSVTLPLRIDTDSSTITNLIIVNHLDKHKAHTRSRLMWLVECVIGLALVWYVVVLISAVIGWRVVQRVIGRLIPTVVLLTCVLVAVVYWDSSIPHVRDSKDAPPSRTIVYLRVLPHASHNFSA